MKKTIAAAACAAIMVMGGKASFAESGILQQSDVNLGVDASKQGVGYQAGLGLNIGAVSQHQSALEYSGPVLPFGTKVDGINVYTNGESGIGGSTATTFGGSMNGALSAGLVQTGQLLYTF